MLDPSQSCGNSFVASVKPRPRGVIRAHVRGLRRELAGTIRTLYGYRVTRLTIPPSRPGSGRLVVCPAFNEAATVGALVRAAADALGCPVLVVSDASTDGTASAARRAGAQVLELAYQLGAWGATQAGIRYAQRNGFTTVITMDADGQHDPACLPRLVADFDAGGADVVIGTHPARLSRMKRVAWRWFRTITGLAIEDLTSGLRVYGPRAIAVLASREATLLDYQDVGVLLLLRRYGLTTREVPAPMFARCNGRSRVFASWLMVGRYMLQTSILCLARTGRMRAAALPAGDTPA